MSLRHTEETVAGEPRYDAATLRKVAHLAARLQSHERETLTADEMEAIGAEAGLEPAFMRKALAQYSHPKRPSDQRPYGAYAAAWWAAGWTIPIVSTAFGKGNLFLILFYLLIGVYIAGGVLLSKAAKRAKAAAQTGASRADLLEMLSSLQGLEERDEHRAFLSVDVIGAAKMKRDGPEPDVEHSFQQFRRWLAEVVEGGGGRLQSTESDGALAVFPTDVAAAHAALRLQEDLPQFNRDHNRLPTPFQLRCGLSAGEVVIDETSALGCRHSPVIDHAAALQQQAEPGEILVSGEVSAAALSALKGATPRPQPVAGEPAFSWRAERDAPPSS